ncbi:hypothetical protein [Streptomyces sp. NPDC057418]
MLKRGGAGCGRRRVARLMRAAGLLAPPVISSIPSTGAIRSAPCCCGRPA